MAIAFRSKSYVAPAATVTITPTEPAGAAQDDILLYWWYLGGAPGWPSSGPSGWTFLNNWVGVGTEVQLFWIKRGGSAPSYTATAVGSIPQSASVSCFSGCDTTSPINATAYNPAQQRNPCDPDCPSATATVSNTVAVALGMGRAFGTWTPPSGYTMIEDSSPGNDFICVAYKALVSAGAEDPGAFGGGGASLNDVAEATVILDPPSGAAVPLLGQACL